LVRLRLASLPLQVDELLDTRLYEDVVAASNTLLKTQVGEQLTKIIEADVGIGLPPKYPGEVWL
jgi:hypothetical protein